LATENNKDGAECSARGGKTIKQAIKRTQSSTECTQEAPVTACCIEEIPHDIGRPDRLPGVIATPREGGGEAIQDSRRESGLLRFANKKIGASRPAFPCHCEEAKPTKQSPSRDAWTARPYAGDCLVGSSPATASLLAMTGGGSRHAPIGLIFIQGGSAAGRWPTRNDGTETQTVLRKASLAAANGPRHGTPCPLDDLQ